jgi:hypothetical protein
MRCWRGELLVYRRSLELTYIDAYAFPDEWFPVDADQILQAGIVYLSGRYGFGQDVSWTASS